MNSVKPFDEAEDEGSRDCLVFHGMHLSGGGRAGGTRYWKPRVGHAKACGGSRMRNYAVPPLQPESALYNPLTRRLHHGSGTRQAEASIR